ncbi:MAG: VOC family protein [Bacteroidetes bacterium]|nr:MAG: VOC family protein [Bacteroidota bacterium]
MARITGIGGIFFKSRGEPAALAAWYRDHLGLTLEEFGGAVLRWPDDTAEDKGMTVWHLAGPQSRWFAPSDSPFMINYRVDDLAGIIERLSRAGIPLLKGPETHENGSFAWLMDPDGNKIELWEPKIWKEKKD